MSKTFLGPTVVHPNLGATSTEGMKGAYDVVIAKNEKFITPDGKKGRVRVFSRVSPEQMLDDKSGKLQAYASKAKSKISDAILKLKAPVEKKNKLIDLMAVQVKGDIATSSSEFFSADMFHNANPLFQIPVQRQVRFVDAANVEIPRNKPAPTPLPTEVILPELPPEI
ncbi:MAG: hypothetical protein NTZ96_02725 [Burkholderiales bacterium]|nr:hypothetical protein [Burkholderiales bacterium]